MKPKNPSSSVSGKQQPNPYSDLTRPIIIGRINVVGVFTLYSREVQRFLHVALQTLAAPVITSLLFFLVFSVAIGNRGNLANGTDFVVFLVRAIRGS